MYHGGQAIWPKVRQKILNGDVGDFKMWWALEVTNELYNLMLPPYASVFVPLLVFVSFFQSHKVVPKLTCLKNVELMLNPHLRGYWDLILFLQ